ncbi:6-carboxytetrahydropterin synthase [Nocardia sp. NPDC050793]|uniref:6-pyruvoyl trahydropterin synthase family protein n=1 Tax=Nocardia sp. NPDC050793 TaxID=3155159 RepID=UPI0033D0CC5D
MSLTITVGHTAEAAHRIPVLSGVGAKCRNVHGHSFVIEWSFRADDVDLEQVEFGRIKRVLRGWIDEHFDHGFVCHVDDPVGVFLAEQNLKVLTLPSWPTTEAIAQYLASVADELLPELTLTGVLLREGPSNQARWTRDHG